MAHTPGQLKIALDESRMLILGAQVLLGFQYSATLERGFERLPVPSRGYALVALALMLIAIALLMAPVAFHRVVLHGEPREELERFTNRITGPALVPFALSFGLAVYLAFEIVGGTATGAIAGAGAVLIALLFWFGIEAFERARRGPAKAPAGKGAAPPPLEAKRMEDNKKPAEDEAHRLETKINEVLTEARIVLPGAQALLGFQFVAMFVEGFDKLSDFSKGMHLASLAAIALSTVLLMTPASFHRLAEDGENTERFHAFASGMVLAAMALLALGVCGELYVVVAKVTESPAGAAALALAMLAVFYGLWFGYTFYRRGRLSEEGGRP